MSLAIFRLLLFSSGLVAWLTGYGWLFLALCLLTLAAVVATGRWSERR